ncbi:MAG TPA: basic amino acid ABC transporter substrate-binding protein [Coriobacteriia bacterium]|jgi:polar amino acid transport system substrate-binding protein
MRKASTWLVLLTVIAMMFVVAACTPQPAPKTEAPKAEKPAATYKLVTPGQITVGSDTSFPPMESLEGNKAVGFDVDLMDAIGKEMGLKVVFQTEQFDTLIASLQANKFDLIASSMTITDDRKKLIDFSDPMFDSNQSLAMKKGSKYNAPADLKGKKIGVQSGTTGEQWATENLKPAGATLVPFKTATEAFSALQAGNVDAVVNDLPVTVDLVKDPAKGLEIVKQIPTGEQYGFAVNKSNPELLKAVNAALKKVKDSGEYDAIYKKWIGSK